MTGQLREWPVLSRKDGSEYNSVLASKAAEMNERGEHRKGMAGQDKAERKGKADAWKASFPGGCAERL